MPTAASSDPTATLDATSPTSSAACCPGVPSLDFAKIARNPQIRAALLVALGYCVGARIGVALTLDPSSAPTLWPPNAILLAGLLLTPVRSWAAVFAATFVAHLGDHLGAHLGAHLAPQLDGGVPLA